MTPEQRAAANALIEIVLQQCGGYLSGAGFDAANKARELKEALAAQPLTDEQIESCAQLAALDECIDDAYLERGDWRPIVQQFSRAIERAHGIGESAMCSLDKK